MAKVRVKNVKASEAAAKVEDAAKRGTKAGKHKLRGKPVSKPKTSKLVKFNRVELTPEQLREKEQQMRLAKVMGAQKYTPTPLGLTLGDLISMSDVENSGLPKHIKKAFRRNK